MAKTKPQVSQFEKALDFLALTFKAGEDQSMYALMDRNFACSYNLIIGLGTPIDVDLMACPHTALLNTAIERCGPTFAITQLSQEKLLVRANDFHAYIPCANPSLLQWPQPDPLMAPLNNNFLEAIEKVAPMADAKADTVVECAIQLRGSSVLSTNRSIVIEAWHGNSMPDGMLLPKMTATALRKAKKDLSGFGFSATTITFYFADNCWLRSQLYQDRAIDIQKHIQEAQQTRLRDIPHDFFAAVLKVAPFSTSGKIWVEGNRVSSHPFDVEQEGSGLALEFSGEGHEYRVYSAHDLKLIRKIATRWDEDARHDGTLFFGDKIRGMIWHERTTPQTKAEYNAAIAHEDDDIPF